MIVINEALARKYFPGKIRSERRLGTGRSSRNRLREIVGVIADVREGGLDDDVWPAEYESMYSSPGTFFSVVVRTAQDEKAMLPSMVKTLHEIDPQPGRLWRDHHDGPDREHTGSAIASVRLVAGGRFCGDCAGTGSRGALWGGCVLCEPADTRDRCAHGTGRAAQGGVWDGDAPGGMADGNRRRDRAGVRRGSVGADAETAFWRCGVGPTDTRMCSDRAGCGFTGCEFPAGAQSSISESDRCATGGVKQERGTRAETWGTQAYEVIRISKQAKEAGVVDLGAGEDEVEVGGADGLVDELRRGPGGSR